MSFRTGERRDGSTYHYPVDGRTTYQPRELTVYERSIDYPAERHKLENMTLEQLDVEAQEILNDVTDSYHNPSTYREDVANWYSDKFKMIMEIFRERDPVRYENYTKAREELSRQM